MKRFLFSVCALAAVVVGCSKSEVLNRPNAEVPIEFNPYTGRIPVTRATAADKITLGEDGFQVYAFLHDSNGEVDYTATPYMTKIVRYGKKTTEDTEDSWYYTGNAYWPASRELTFIAYGLNADSLISRPDNGEEKEFTYTIPSVVADQKDLLVAKAMRGEKYDEEKQDGTVNFVFSHLLSRIGFSLVTKADGTLVTIEQVNLKGEFYKEGKVDLTLFTALETSLNINGAEVKAYRPYILPTVAAEEITYSLLPGGSYTNVGAKDNGTPIFDNSMLYEKYTGDENTTDDDEYKPKSFKTEAGADDAEAKAAANATAAANQTNRYMMIIPTSTPGISNEQPAKDHPHGAKLYVKYFLPGAGTFDEVEVDLSAIKFEQGKSYDFKLRVSTSGISFDVVVEDWDTTGDSATGTNPPYELN
jgi:hypothetical protein